MRNEYDSKSDRDLFGDNHRAMLQLSQALRAAGLGEAHRDLLAHAEAVGMATWRRRAAFPAAEPELVLDMRMVGYVSFGDVGNLITIPDPGLAGLQDACRIFGMGVATGAYGALPISSARSADRVRPFATGSVLQPTS